MARWKCFDRFDATVYIRDEIRNAHLYDIYAMRPLRGLRSGHAVVCAVPAVQGRQASRTVHCAGSERPRGLPPIGRKSGSRQNTGKAGLILPLFPDEPPLERPFLSADVARLAGITLRQLQWWDEQKVITPRKKGHRRLYTLEQVLEIVILAALRRKGLSLQRIRRVQRLLRRELAKQGSNVWSAKSRLYLITDGNSIFINDQVENILNWIEDATKPVHLISLSDHVGRVTALNEVQTPQTEPRPSGSGF